MTSPHSTPPQRLGLDEARVHVRVASTTQHALSAANTSLHSLNDSTPNPIPNPNLHSLDTSTASTLSPAPYAYPTPSPAPLGPIPGPTPTPESIDAMLQARQAERRGKEGAQVADLTRLLAEEVSHAMLI